MPQNAWPQSKKNRQSGESRRFSWRNSSLAGSTRWLVPGGRVTRRIGREKLGMIRRTSKVGVQDFLAVGLIVMLTCRFGGDEDRVDLTQNMRIIESHGPAVLVGIVLVQEPETVCHFFDPGF